MMGWVAKDGRPNHPFTCGFPTSVFPTQDAVDPYDPPRDLGAAVKAADPRYLDLHYYRQGGDTTDVTRSLWDPTYVDPSWIDSRIQLIPRMKRWVARNYPGTKLALSEYNLSVDGSAVTNALIQADTLGIFAREGSTSPRGGRWATTVR
jgi:hypothetical protein